MNRRFYTLHRWVSALAFLQFAAWMISGTFFAVVPIERVRGDAVKAAHKRPIVIEPTGRAVLGPAQLLPLLAPLGVASPSSIELRGTPSGLFYVVHTDERSVRLDAQTGELVPVGREEAEATARRDQPGSPPVTSATLVTTQPLIEYRGRSLPAWRVTLADRHRTVIYIDAAVGEVTARCNNLWRIYDFLWSLHIMDYRGREHFNHPLLIGAAALGVLTVLSGATLWVLRILRRLRRAASRSKDLPSMRAIH